MGIDKLPDIITLQELANFIKVSETTIRRAFKSGELKGFKIGKDWRFEKDEVLKWLGFK